MVIGEVIPSRVLNELHLYLDTGFLLVLAAVLLLTKRYAAPVFLRVVRHGLLK